MSQVGFPREGHLIPPHSYGTWFVLVVKVERYMVIVLAVVIVTPR